MSSSNCQNRIFDAEASGCARSVTVAAAARSPHFKAAPIATLLFTDPAMRGVTLSRRVRRRSRMRGFSLIETLIAMGILITGLVAVASIFAYSVRTSAFAGQMAAGIVASETIMESLASRGFNAISAGGGLDPSSPQTGYFSYGDFSATGTFTMSSTNSNLPYLATWRINGGNPKLITVSVSVRQSGLGGVWVELARTTTQVSR